MIEMSGTFDGVGVRVRKPRDKLLDSFGVLTILAGKLESTEGVCREGKLW